jgi:hypothetical protein
MDVLLKQQSNYRLQTAYCCIFGDVGQEGILLSTACTKRMK